MFELLCSYAEDCRNGIEHTDFTNEDIIEFVEDTEDLRKTLTPEQEARFHNNLVYTGMSELIHRYMNELDEVKIELLKKYHLYQGDGGQT